MKKCCKNNWATVMSYGDTERWLANQLKSIVYKVVGTKKDNVQRHKGTCVCITC